MKDEIVKSKDVLVFTGSFSVYFPSVSSGTSLVKESINTVAEKPNYDFKRSAFHLCYRLPLHQ